MEEKSTHINKEDKTMSEKAKLIHNAYCDYEVAKAKSPSRIYVSEQKHGNRMESKPII